MDEDGFISNISIGNINFTNKIHTDKKKDKRQKYLEKKNMKKQNRKKYKEIVQKKKRENTEDQKKNYNNNSYRPSRRINPNEEDNTVGEKSKLTGVNNPKYNSHESQVNTKENKKNENKQIKINNEEEVYNENNENNENKENKENKENNESDGKGKIEKSLKNEYQIEKYDNEVITHTIQNEKNINTNNFKNESNIINKEERQLMLIHKKENILLQNQNNYDPNKKLNPSQTVFSVKLFNDLKIDKYLKKAIEKNGYIQMTKIQKKAIPLLLEHKNVIVKSETGSGKTLAYTIPLYQQLIELNNTNKISRKNGVYSIIFSPTHELCMQIEKTCDKLKSSCINVIYGTLMGGQKIDTEKKKLRKGLNIIITTPGRLLYHLQKTENINLNTLKTIIIDEADLMLDMGFEKDIKECFKYIINKSISESKIDSIDELNPDFFKKYKIYLISATIDNRIRKMTSYFMKGFKTIGFEKEDDKNNKINNNEKKEEEINDNNLLSALKLQNISQFYSYINDEYRLIHLIAFLYNNLSQKTIIFVSTCDLCDYLSKLISEIEIDINYKNDGNNAIGKEKSNNSKTKFIHLLNSKTYKLHGKMKHDERKIVFEEFNNDDHGILIATDVAARGLDFKNVIWVIHYDINPNIKEYINRIGRTGRIDNVGSSILFLMQNERKLIDTCFKPIKNNLIEFKNYEILTKFIQNINNNILNNKIDMTENNKKDEDALDENELYRQKYSFAINPLLKCIKNFIFLDKNNLILARKAFKSEIRSYVIFLKYAKDVFNVKALNLTRMSRSFGLYKESLSMKVGKDQVNVDYQIEKKEKYTQKKFLNKKIQNKLIYSEFE